MKVLISFLVVGCLISLNGMAQNVGIGTAVPDASAKLDIVDPNRGLLIPRVALSSTAVAAPVAAPATSLLVYNTATAGVAPTNVTPGYYYWNGAAWVRFFSGNAWLVGGNVNTAIERFGTISNHSVDLVSNNVVRGRLSNLGEFFIGTTVTALAGDLMNALGNATFPWAINGYTSFNGSGVYGAVQAGTTIYGGVQGEYFGTAATGTGTRGIYGSNVGGTGFNASASGVSGQAISTGSYKFGVYGSGGTSARSGGVMGYDYGIAGALGYWAANGVDYSVYGFGGAYQTGIAGGKYAQKSAEANTHIGMGMYGGVMGAWIRGLHYGTTLKGERYALYVEGKTYTNEPITHLHASENDNRVASYGTSGMSVDVTAKGMSQLINGTKYISFTEDFKVAKSDSLDLLIITVTPMGQCGGLYIDDYDANGFYVKEIGNGQSEVKFSWIAVGTRRGFEVMDHAPEVLASDFDQKLNGLMFNDLNENDTPQPIWFDGTEIRFDNPPVKEVNPNGAFTRPGAGGNGGVPQSE